MGSSEARALTATASRKDSGDGVVPVTIVGTVVRGDERGRLLGFPTANLADDGRVGLLRDGVYAGRAVTAHGGEWPAAISVGRPPTFYASSIRVIEAHLVDFSGDLYGQVLELTFVRRLRGQVRFADVDGLKEQLSEDISAVRTLWAGGALMSPAVTRGSACSG